MPLSTKTKIAIAKVAHRVVSFPRKVLGIGSRVVVTRNGLSWELDLNEGIDFAIFLLGMFERQTVNAYRRMIRPGDVVLDIGANVGAHTLHFARCVGPNGLVVAFEPTDFAFHKLLRNVSRNPTLAPRIRAEQAMIVASQGDRAPGQLYSSWPLVRHAELHGEHCGKLMDINGARTETLDGFVQRAHIQRVSFIKIDVDGYEGDVLRGSLYTLARFKPTLIMELAPYTLEERGSSIDELLEILGSAGYTVRTLAHNRILPQDPDAIRAMIPRGSSLNVQAKPADS